MNQQEFVAAVTPFRNKIFRVAQRLLVSTEEAEDAVQETMTKLWMKRDELDKYNSVEALAMTMVKNFCLDQLKSKRAGNLRIVHTNYTDRQAGLQQTMEDRNSLDWVEKAMDSLPEQQKLIIQLREVEEYEFEEIAKIMEMNETAVRVALSRGRKTIREFMQKTHSYGIR